TSIFTKRDGGALIPGTTAIWLRRFAQRHGLRPVTPHKLRHTFATLQIAYGTDIRTVAGVMGHSSPTTTLTIYAHQVKEASEKAARAMSEILSP
ncbi:MAG: tyrosine-type recombinase/integrase, partial [Firmicutes bacterium]|nr:tyrosine-type recombinase/integrase [Bacillota bacterium]